MYDLKYSTIGCTNATTTPFGGSKRSFLWSSGIGLVVTCYVMVFLWLNVHLHLHKILPLQISLLQSWYYFGDMWMISLHCYNMFSIYHIVQRKVGGPF